MPIPPDIVKCYKYIDLHKNNYINELQEIVSIPNVSAEEDAKKHLLRLVNWMSNRLKQLGFSVSLMQPDYKRHKGNKPPIIVGTLGKDPSKKTLLYYCHLDVLKVRKNRWKTDPFKLTEIDRKLYGRGSAKMKGPILCFVHAVESYRVLGIEIPINIKIICESMYECQSAGLNDILDQLKATYLPKIDCVLITDSHWLGKNYPCITYGTRGVVYFNLKIEGPCKNLNSGDFGGIVREPMQDLLYIIKSLVDPSGKITIPNFNDDVVNVTSTEEDFYERIKIDLAEYKKSVGVKKLGHEENLKLVLMHVWRYPWFNIHYINSSNEQGNVLDIPNKVLARFSIRIVPNQTHKKTTKLVIDYINDCSEQMKTTNKIDITSENPLDPWYEDHLHWNYEAANAATKQVYKEEASFVREGNGFPTLLKIRDSLPNRNILILPIVNSEAKAHSEEENISIQSYIEGTKLLVSYFYQLREISKKHANRKACKERDML